MESDRGPDSFDTTLYRSRLKEWGRKNLRTFPWRKTSDPYRVLMAELMLIRTSAEQVEPIYQAFVREYPTVESLSRASREEVKEILSPLGLAWRAECVYDTAVSVVQEHHKKIPDEKDTLMDLSGVSQYVANAVLCFAYGEPKPLIDTNTVRIAGRIFSMEVTNSSRRDERFQQIIQDLMDTTDPQLYNYSMLDLGAKVCTSRSPNCSKCPIQPMCRYGRDR